MPRKSRKQKQTEIESPKIIKYITWGYTRISNDGIKADDSIEGQTALIQDYVSDKPDLDLQNIITDIGFSGTDFIRPGYAELLDAIQHGKVQCVIVKDLSRLGREYIEVGELLFDTFPTYNMRFLSVNDQYDSFADDAGRKKLMILFKNLVNHMYSKDLGVKVRSSLALKQQKGELLGSLPPYGYVFTDEGGRKHLKIEPEAAKIVKLIFDMREQGNSLYQIANYLNQNDIPSPRHHMHKLGYLPNVIDTKKYLWQDCSIRKILRNITHLGHQVQGKEESCGNKARKKPQSEWIIHENTHPTLIDKTQFDIVQKLLDESAEKYAKKRDGLFDEYIYSGKLFCSRCTRAIVRQLAHPKDARNYYRLLCRTCGPELRHSLGLNKLPTFLLAELEEIITVVLQNQINVCLDIRELIVEVSKSKIIINKHHNLTSKLNRLRNESKKADDMLASSYTHHLAGLLDSREFSIAREKFEKDKKTAESRIEQISLEVAKYDIEKANQNAFLVNFQRFNGFKKLDKEIVNALIQRIEIDPLTKDFHIVLNYMDELEELNKLVEESGVLADVRQ